MNRDNYAVYTAVISKFCSVSVYVKTVPLTKIVASVTLRILLRQQGVVSMFTRISQSVMPPYQILRTSGVIKQASGIHHDQTES